MTFDGAGRQGRLQTQCLATRHCIWNIDRDIGMWKIALGFIAFAALAMFVVMKGGDKLDMAGEQHGVEASHAAPAAAPASAVASK